MKTLITGIILAFSITTPALAKNSYKTNATVTHHYKTQYFQEPINTEVCRKVKVPVYGYSHREGNAAGGALLGMIIGGAVGKGLTGKNDGAAAGAVVGGIIGADQGSKAKQEKVIVGYEYTEKCEIETEWVKKSHKVYSHSTIEFMQGGETYKIRYSK